MLAGAVSPVWPFSVHFEISKIKSRRLLHIFRCQLLHLVLIFPLSERLFFYNMLDISFVYTCNQRITFYHPALMLHSFIFCPTFSLAADLDQFLFYYHFLFVFSVLFLLQFSHKVLVFNFESRGCVSLKTSGQLLTVQLHTGNKR